MGRDRGPWKNGPIPVPSKSTAAVWWNLTDGFGADNVLTSVLGFQTPSTASMAKNSPGADACNSRLPSAF